MYFIINIAHFRTCNLINDNYVNKEEEKNVFIALKINYKEHIADLKGLVENSMRLYSHVLLNFQK